MESDFSRDDSSKVKGLAIVLMVMHHCFLSPTRYDGFSISFFPFDEHMLVSISLSFKICVALFVFVSSYGITISYNRYGDIYKMTKCSINRTILRRVVKMMMGYVFVFLLTVLFSILVMRDNRFTAVYGHSMQSIVYFIIDLLGLAWLFGTPSFIHTYWYMSLAILLVVMMPILLKIYKRNGAMIVLFLASLARVFFVPGKDHYYANLPDYLFTACIGIYCAESNVIGIIDSWLQAKSRVFYRSFLIFTIIAVCLLLYLRLKFRETSTMPLWDGLIAPIICLQIHCFMSNTSPISRLLTILGIHSINIYLIHNYIRDVWFKDFIYGLHYWWLIVAGLITVSLAISFIIEQLKKELGYRLLEKRIITAISSADTGHH